MRDLIDRQSALDCFHGWMDKHGNAHEPDEMPEYQRIEALPPVEPEPHWIPFKTRPLMEEEKEHYPDYECILDCELPDNGQRILVTIKYKGHESVQYDEYYDDDGSYLDSGYNIATEATAWMPLPAPYQKEGD